MFHRAVLKHGPTFTVRRRRTGDAVSELDRTPHGADAPGAPRTWCLTALTDIWTGDAERKGDRLIPTGLLGSIRWWFEVVVRGLGGSACDPSEDQCPGDRKKLREAGHHCVVCEFFGCTGWARKFRFDVLDEHGRTKTTKIVKGQDFKLRFTPLRCIEPQEWALLDLTLRLIANYAAIGGKTTSVRKEFGLVELSKSGDQVSCNEKIGRGALEDYVRERRWRSNPLEPNRDSVDDPSPFWASLGNFWFVARGDRRLSELVNALSKGGDKKWLLGCRGKSKRIFIFGPHKRTFGFFNSAELSSEKVEVILKSVWRNLNDKEVVVGSAALDRLLRGDGVTRAI